MRLWLGALCALLLLTGVALYFAARRAHDSPALGGQGELYTCSMHPTIQSASAGSCPICGMTLTSLTLEQAASGAITVDESRQRIGGVRVAAASVEEMSLSILASGRVAYDETGARDVTVRVPGYITAMNVRSVGEEVRAGETLLTLQSPELYAAQRDFLAKRSHSHRAAREQLMLFGMSEEQIDALVHHGAPQLEFELPAPISGFAITKEVVVGARVQPGQRALRLASTQQLWVEADVDDRDLPELKQGHSAQITADYLPGRIYEGKIIYMYRFLETTARTGRVRIGVDNAMFSLRPGMLVSVKFQADLGPRLQIPTTSILYTGPRRLVFLNEGEGQFRPREVQVGRQSNGMMEVVAGLQPGQLIAVSGTFLLGAEARIATNTPFFDRMPTESDGHAAAAMHEAMQPSPLPTAAATPPATPVQPLAATPAQQAQPAAARPAVQQPSTTAASAAQQPPPAAATALVASPPSAAKPAQQPPAAAAAPAAPTGYVCPMHPDVQSDRPGKCPKCGMNLEPARERP